MTEEPHQVNIWIGEKENKNCVLFTMGNNDIYIIEYVEVEILHKLIRRLNA
jgi:hypothetical protein